MIDAWLIFTLFIPFLEVILNTRMEVLNQRIKSLDLVINLKSLNDSDERNQQMFNLQEKNAKSLRYIFTFYKDFSKHHYLGCIQNYSGFMAHLFQSLENRAKLEIANLPCKLITLKFFPGSYKIWQFMDCPF